MFVIQIPQSSDLQLSPYCPHPDFRLTDDYILPQKYGIQACLPYGRGSNIVQAALQYL
jgi:hypothetical protein